MNKFRNKAGRLTPYALACGYLEQFERNGSRVTLWHEGGPLYHVRHHSDLHGRVFWDSFETITAARKRYDTAIKTI